MQLTTHTYLPCHQDRNNVGNSWIIGLGQYEGGRLWTESPTGGHPPAHSAGGLAKGTPWRLLFYHDVHHKWLEFNGTRYHAVEP
eukprot:1336995-Amphidinium_carterae.1